MSLSLPSATVVSSDSCQYQIVINIPSITSGAKPKKRSRRTKGKIVSVASRSGESIAVSTKLASYRRSKGLTQSDLATLIGVNTSTIRDWENGRNLAPILRILKLCKELNTDIRKLFEICS